MNTYDDPRWTERLALIAVVAVIGAGLFIFLRGSTDGTASGLAGRPVAAAAGAPETTVPETTVPETTVPEPVSDEPADMPTSTEPATSEPAPGDLVADAPVDVLPETGSDTASGDTADSAPDSSVSPDSAPGSGDTSPVAGGLEYPSAPDGTPLPIVATYAEGMVTLTGHVPSEAARARLAALAAANSQDDAEVIDRMIVNERVPINVGVRVIETNSPRFPEGDVVLTAGHAAQLGRVATIMAALPNITVLVIGHADQRGGEATNLALSNDRARAVVDYLAYLGVAPTRMSSQAAGESHLLTLEDDEASLALNRRTEFVFFGILVE